MINLERYLIESPHAGLGWNCCADTCSAFTPIRVLGLYRPRAMTNIYTMTEPSIFVFSNCVALFQRQKHTHTYMYKLDTDHKVHPKTSTHLTGSDLVEPAGPHLSLGAL